ncbi:hypothetical protein [Paenibacillus sp. FSL R7-0337]|uniref:hypothetical protein n=1 Tax=Paenibacillus sp. FSL R7-0337 TaxID=1926588 RepID=UPI00096BDF53|nr:hypothetical protein [Paenibacillus sp. FSL R7-0337]OMF96922.1 hypothetical protein BK147_12250 [Paenibacillus sp. FSL R7-0337]
MSTDNQALPPAPITEPGRYVLDLTGPGSHTLDRKPGMGSLSIGPRESKPPAEVLVAADERMNWSVFEPFATPAGSPWPRYLSYTGGDAGFLEWAERRPIETISWTPVLPEGASLDGSRADIYTLGIKLGPLANGQLSLVLPDKLYNLSLSGDLTRFSASGHLPTTLALVPNMSRRRSDAPYRLPDLGELQGVTHLTLNSPPLGQPISLDGLEQFPNLESLSLWGSFCDLDALARLMGLTSLELRFMPELEGLPSLDTWPLLDRFIAYNVEEAVGKRLRQQMKARAKVRPWDDYASISQLRKPEWWQSEYGRPFSAWPKRLAKLANEAYDTAQSAIAEARNLEEAEAAITAFTLRFNSLKGIETTEREDLGEAVWQLSQSEHQIGQPITEEVAQGWFDAARDY